MARGNIYDGLLPQNLPPDLAIKYSKPYMEPPEDITQAMGQGINLSESLSPYKDMMNLLPTMIKNKPKVIDPLDEQYKKARIQKLLRDNSADPIFRGLITKTDSLNAQYQSAVKSGNQDDMKKYSDQLDALNPQLFPYFGITVQEYREDPEGVNKFIQDGLNTARATIGMAPVQPPLKTRYVPKGTPVQKVKVGGEITPAQQAFIDNIQKASPGTSIDLIKTFTDYPK